MNKARFITLVSIGDAPQGSELEVVELKNEDGEVVDIRYGIPGSLILLTEAETRAKSDLFVEVPRASFGNLCGLLDTADKENHLYLGEDFVSYSIKGKEWVRKTFDGSSEHLALLALGFAVSFPTNAKQLMTRLDRLSKAFNLNISNSDSIIIAGEADIDQSVVSTN